MTHPHKIIAALTIAAALLLSPAAQADYILHLYAYHPNDNGGTLTNNVYGIGYQQSAYTVGLLRNSHSHTSTYALRDFKVNDYLTASAGLITGYQYPLTPIASLGLTLGPVVLTYIPRVKSFNKQVLVFSVRF